MYQEFPPVTCPADLGHLDPAEVREGYQHGFIGCCPPTSADSRSYHHGWRNGAADGGHIAGTMDQFILGAILNVVMQPQSRRQALRVH